MKNELMQEVEDIEKGIYQEENKDDLIPCAICGEFLVAIELQDNATGAIRETMICPACWNNDVVAIGHFIFGKYVVAE